MKLPQWKFYILALLLAGVTARGQTASPAPEYRLRFGDTVSVRVNDLPEADWEGEIDTQGNISLFLVDEPLRAMCRTTDELTREIAKRYAKILRKPQLVVTLVSKNPTVEPPVLVLGAVEKPSRFLLNRRVRLSELLAAAGGPGKLAGKNVRVVPTVNLARCDDNGAPPQRELYSSLLYPLDAVLRRDEKADALVYAGDVVTVLDRDLVYVNGFVAQPLALPFANGLTLWQAIGKTGGFANDANLSRVQVIRRSSWNSQRQEITVDLRAITKGAAPDFALQPNDAILVPCTGCHGRVIKCETCAQTPAQTDLMQTIRTLPLKVIE